MNKNNLIFYSILFLLAFPIVPIERFFGVSTLLRTIQYPLLLLLFLLTLNPGHYFLRRIPRELKIILIYFISISIVSAILNHSSIFYALLELRWLFMIIILYVLLLQVDFQYKYIKSLLIIGFLQTPIVLIQYIYYKIFIGSTSTDLVTGFFPKFHILVFYQVSCFIIILALSLYKRKIFSLPTMAQLILILIPLVLSNSKAAWILLVFTSMQLLFLRGFTKIIVLRKAILSISLLLIALMGFNSIYSKNYRLKKFEYFWNPSVILNYNLAGYGSTNELLTTLSTNQEVKLVDGSLGRLGSLVYNYSKINRNNKTLLFGLGPYFSVQSTKSTLDGYKRRNIFELKYIKGHSLSKILGSLGFAGLLGLAVLFAYFINTIRSKYFMPGFREIGISIFSLTILCTYYFDVIQIPIAMLFVTVLLVAPKDPYNYRYG